MNDRQRLEAIIGVVCRHLPPDGIPVNEAMSQIIALVDPLPAPVQEPVEAEDTLFRQFMSEAEKAGITHWPTPPEARRQWVGLTQEEFRDFATTFEYGTGGLIRAIEAKLKERNT